MHSGLKVDDIYAVELIGGATRVPKLQAKLQEFLGRKELDRHLDADEAIALGSSLHAANLSDGIKLNRKLGMIDGSSYGFMVELIGTDLVKEDSTKFLLVPYMKKMPIKLFRSISHNKDFDVSLSYENANELPPGFSSAKFAEFSISGLTETTEKYSTRNLSSPIKATMHFSLSRSGLVSLDRAEAVIELSEWVGVPKKNQKQENNATNTINVDNNANSSTEATLDNMSDKEVLSTENGANNTSDSNGELKDEVQVETEKVLKKRTFRVPLKVEEKVIEPGILSKDMLTEAKTRLEVLDKRDAERRRTAELKNSLEEYIYSTREKLEDDENIKKVSSEDERQAFVEKLSEAQDWLYTDGEDASANDFKERLDSLKAIGDPIFFRLNELTARPAAFESSRLYLDELQKIFTNWEKNKPWIPKSRVEEITSEAENLRSWLQEKKARQKETPDFSNPIVTSEEIYEKVSKLQDKVSAVNRIPKPKPKVEKPPKEDSTSNNNSTDGTNSTPDDESIKKDQPAEESSGSTTSDDVKPEPHDEL
ncbi:hypothetical protein HPP92_000271 [Vanilla planifolia]|uniref:Uncharacterized protein n=1 Tax=Vanilla planifolia TaxID=51239 RepID=A0A835VFY0_VANPL|nr:hypothetical protein HPP92_000271 [Vanilla planifolia]